MRGEIILFFIIKQIKSPQLFCCKAFRKRSRIQEVGKNIRLGLVFSPYTSFVLYHFLRALQQNRAQSRPLYLSITDTLKTQRSGRHFVNNRTLQDYNNSQLHYLHAQTRQRVRTIADLY